MTITENTETAAGQATVSPTEAVNPGKAAESAAAKVESKSSKSGETTASTKSSKSGESKSAVTETTVEKGPGVNLHDGPTMAEETVSAAPEN